MKEIPLNEVVAGDCLEVLKTFPAKSIDLVITDPPYGMNFQSHHRKVQYDKIEGDNKFPIEVFQELFRIAKRGVYVFCRWDNLIEVPPPKSVLAWVKNNWSMGDLKHEHGRQWEAICFYPQEEHEFISRIPDVIHEERTGNNYHPTEKPVDLLQKLIMANVCETILDPFCGSGSTLMAAKMLHKNYIGIEINEGYAKIARERLNGVTQRLL